MQVGEKKRFSRHPSLPTKADNHRLLLDNVTPLRHVQTVKELCKKIIMSVINRDNRKVSGGYSSYLTDILVADTADLLDVGSTLGDTLQGVTGDLELILNVGGGDDLNARLGGHTADVLLTQEVSVKRNTHQQNVLSSKNMTI